MAKKIIGEDGKEYVLKENKPFYKRWWFIILAIGVIVQIPSMLLASSEIKTFDEEEIEVEEVQEDDLAVDDSKITREEYIEYTDGVRNIIIETLDTPEKLKFPINSTGSDDWKIKKDDGVMYVQSYVEGKNAFGTKIRENFQVSVDMETKEVLEVIIGDDRYN